jgi:hypothetical protein
MDMLDVDMVEQVEHFRIKLKVALDSAHGHGHAMPARTEVVIHLEPSTDGYDCFYYCVDHERKLLFWLNQFEADEMLQSIQGRLSWRHISESSLYSHHLYGSYQSIRSELQVEKQYWYGAPMALGHMLF